MSLKDLIPQIVNDTSIHARWLNTLSLMENTGARKIIHSENEIGVTEIILKHAAEEARHAYYLKKQISKLNLNLKDYSDEFLIAPLKSRHYLKALDVYASRYLINRYKLSGRELKYGSYLLVTYAIEVRADDLYPVYQTELDRSGSRVNVKSIIAEEEGHLQEMIHQLKEFSTEWEKDTEAICAFEKILFENWITEIEKQIEQPVNN